MPTVSILMSVYNNARDLPLALESLCNQTFQDFEAIIIDDGSTDESSDILTKLASHDPRFKIIRRERLGLTKNLNYAFSLSSGQFVARMDADDISLSARLEKQVVFLSVNPDIAVVGSYFDKIDDEGQLIATQADLPLDDLEIRKQLMEKNPLCHGSIMMRRDAFIGYREVFAAGQDYDMWLRMPPSFKFAIIPEVLYQHRRNSGSVSQNRYLLQQQMAKLAREMFQARESINPAKDFLDCYETLEEQQAVVTAYLADDAKRHAKVYSDDLCRIGKRQETVKNYAGARKTYLQALRLNPLCAKVYVKWLATFVKH